MKKILILGGTGFLGQNIVKQLADDYYLVVTGRDISNPIRHPNVVYRTLDFVQCEDYSSYLKDADLVIHLISTINPNDDMDHVNSEIEQNVFPTIKLLDDMVKNKIPEIIFLSSGGAVYGECEAQNISETESLDPISNYGIIKMLIEKYLQLYHRFFGVNYKIVRLANPYSENTKIEQKQGIIPILADKILNHEVIDIWGDGNNLRDFIFIDDAIEAIRRIIEYNGDHKVFNLGTGIGHSLNDCIDLIKKYSNISEVTINYSAPRKCDVKNNILDISNTAKTLNWKPQTQLDEGIKKVLAKKCKERNENG